MLTHAHAHAHNTANPLLEAFGNAKTIRNNNSSRFGKFIEIHYSQQFTVTGGLFLHYLLEKSRICVQSPGERNYHIFYQLCACLPQAQWQELGLASPDKFHYLRNGCTQYFCSRESDAQLDNARKSAEHRRAGAVQDQLIDDVRCYEQTDKALSSFGVSDDLKAQIYSIVAAVLHLGNVSFCEDTEDARNCGCRVQPHDGEQALAHTARLMGLDADLLRQALVSRIMSTTRGGHKGTVYMVQLNVQQAQAARDALAKAIYSKLFDYIVTRIVNKSIPFESSAFYIGVLDVAGFEYFQHNSFEQFLINFCNEKLQQFFNERILKEEQNIYEKEGLQLERVEFTDNQDCIQLFEAKATGIFDLLDEQSRLPKPSASNFTQSVHAANKQHFRLAVPRASKLRAHREIRDDEGFLVRHFAGAVCYETQQFIDKNNDALHASLRNIMLDAGHALLRELFSAQTDDAPAPAVAASMRSPSSPPAFAAGTFGSSTSPVQRAGGEQSNKLNFASVASNFRAQLADLMGKLRATGSHFIRCIKPNSEMVAKKFEGGQILSQLHCSGMDSVLELMQRGYPSRSSFADLYATYAQLLPAELARLDPHLFCRALFKAVGLSDADFRFGASKVFLRPGKFAEFDQIIRSDKQHVLELVRKVARWLVRARWRKAQYCALCALKLTRKILFRRAMIIRLQTNWRAALVSRKLRFRLNALRAARAIERSLDEFEHIGARELKKSAEIDEQTRLLRDELAEFVRQIGAQVQQLALANLNDTNNNSNKQQQASSSSSRAQDEESKLQCERQLDKLATKRDLLVRAIKDKIAKQKELVELERKMALEQKRREDEELAKRREEDIKQQRNELERRRQQELAAAAAAASKADHQQQETRTMRRRPQQPQAAEQQQQHSAALEEQEQRDYEIALRLAQDSSSGDSSAAVAGISSSGGGGGATPTRRTPLPPSENYTNASELATRYDLTKWKYSDLRDTINTSCDLQLLEACKREFHRRLKVYHAWRALNSRQSLGEHEQRAPQSVMANHTNCDGQSSNGSADSSLDPANAAQAISGHEQRYFRIPFVKGNSNNSQQRGWWFAHFDGQWIARQLELHPDRKPLLLVAGQHDIEMCELSLKETRLTSKRGAEILAQEFEDEWRKHGGQPYVRSQQLQAAAQQRHQPHIHHIQAGIAGL